MQARLIEIKDYWGHPFEELNYYKVYHDGGHYVGTRLIRSKSKRPPKKPVDTDIDMLAVKRCIIFIPKKGVPLLLAIEATTIFG